jgi:DNA repair exonuclease SbcCD ATPase subunit
VEESLGGARSRVEELERALSVTETGREARAQEARELAARVETLEAEREAALEARTRAEEAVTATTARVQELEREISAAVAGREADGSRARELTSRIEALEAEREAAAEGGRRANLALATAREQLEEGRRSADAAEARANRAEEELRTAQRELALARARGTRPEETGDLQARLEEARAAAGAAEARAGELQTQWGKATAAVAGALTALRRAAFVPPPLRVSLEEAGGVVEAGGRPARRSGIALLDRDVVGLEQLAGELEAAGIEVRIANQPEELALLLRTAEAGAIDAVVCDVMSFRPEQNVAGLIRSWDKDRPGLAFYLGYDTQSSAETERARRIPMSLTAGHLPRPLTAARLVETIENLARRQGKA